MSVNEKGLTVQVEKKQFIQNGQLIDVLEDINFRAPQASVTTLFGSSGIGKSTLLRLISGVDTNYNGVIRFSGQPMQEPLTSTSVVFQDSRLLEWKNLLQNIELGLIKKFPKLERKELCLKALKDVKLHDAALKFPRQLSEGMARRGAFARALVRRPELLLLDEPFTGLDIPNRNLLVKAVESHCINTLCSVVLVTHGIDEALMLSDQIIVLAGTPASITHRINVPLAKPRDPYSSQFQTFRSHLLKKAILTTN